jgi:hypothetical protein
VPAARQTLSIDDLLDIRYDLGLGGSGMTWVNDLASGLGMPVGAAALAGAMYAACAAAERAARPEALKDIGRILKDASWHHSVRPSSIITRLFNLTFGERQLSWKCVIRSCVATISIVVSAFGIQITLAGELEKTFFPQGMNVPPVFVAPFIALLLPLVAILIGALPDYLALWKTRVLLSHASDNRSPPAVILVLLVDVCLSLSISVLFWWTLSGFESLTAEAGKIFHDILHFTDTSGSLAPTVISTLFTSVWIILILVSTATLKLLVPLQRFTTWFFDVEEHPVQAIGIVSGSIVMIGSLVWSLVRWMI